MALVINSLTAAREKPASPETQVLALEVSREAQRGPGREVAGTRSALLERSAELPLETRTPLGTPPA